METDSSHASQPGDTPDFARPQCDNCQAGSPTDNDQSGSPTIVVDDKQSSSPTVPSLLPHRHRDVNYSPSTLRRMEAILGSSPPRLLRMPRDDVQPQMGSIPDLHSDTETPENPEDAEVDDFFPTTEVPFRQRSATCPENRSYTRRAKARMRRLNVNRPPTPPPGDADSRELDLQLNRLVVKNRLHIPDRALPEVNEKACS